MILWQEFCDQYKVLERGVPLFETVDHQVVTMPYGEDGHLVLNRHEQMEEHVIGEVNKLIREYEEGTGYFDGLIYMMYRVQHGK